MPRRRDRRGVISNCINLSKTVNSPHGRHWSRFTSKQVSASLIWITRLLSRRQLRMFGRGFLN
nr:MAG TPA: hypothetical protein [Caudoviricetes sp.]